MTHTRIEDKEKIKTIIFQSWFSDDKFFEEYSVFNSPDESLVDTTNKVICFIDAYKAEFYDLLINYQSVGYLVIAKDLRLIFSFAIKKEFRTLEIKKDFMATIVGLFGEGPVAVSLYNKNTRAIEFFKGNGYNEQEQECVTLVKYIK